MKRTISIIAFALLASWALAASAQGQEERIDDVTEYTFPDEAVVGGIIGADGARVSVRPKPKTHSLIKVRSNFVQAMLTSVEDI
jgi:hypothetical protein